MLPIREFATPGLDLLELCCAAQLPLRRPHRGARGRGRLRASQPIWATHGLSAGRRRQSPTKCTICTAFTRRARGPCGRHRQRHPADACRPGRATSIAPAFWIKMGLVVALFINGSILVRTALRAEAGDAAARAGLRRASVASIILWFATTLVGAILPQCPVSISLAASFCWRAAAACSRWAHSGSPADVDAARGGDRRSRTRERDGLSDPVGGWRQRRSRAHVDAGPLRQRDVCVLDGLSARAGGSEMAEEGQPVPVHEARFRIHARRHLHQRPCDAQSRPVPNPPGRRIGGRRHGPGLSVGPARGGAGPPPRSGSRGPLRTA